MEADENRVALRAEFSHDAPRPMIDSLQVQNFRCFQNLELNGLGNINIVVGKNGAGKTALLESICLPGSNPNLPFIFRQFRGVANRPILAQRQAYENLWKDLFFRFSQNVPIQISLKGTTENNRELKIYYDPETERPLVVTGFQDKSKEVESITSDSLIIVPIVFETFAHGQTYKLPVKMAPNGQITLAGTQPVGRVSYYPASFVPNPGEVAGMFSNLRVSKQDKRLSDLIHDIFPSVSDLSSEQPFPSGGQSEVYCSVPGIPEKVPLALVSNGINRFLHIMLYIANQPKGVILLDELETGLHHSIFGQLWEAILRQRNEYGGQLFITTHSKECLDALKPLLTEENLTHFRLIRMEELKPGIHTSRIFKGENFAAALETGTEIR